MFHKLAVLVLYMCLLVLVFSTALAEDLTDEPITPENADHIQLRSMLGRGIIRSYAWSVDGLHLALENSRGLWLMDAHSFDIPPHQLDSMAYLSRKLVFSPDGSTLAEGVCLQFVDFSCQQQKIRLWDTTHAKQIVILSNDSIGYTDLIFSSDGSQIAAAYEDDIAVWETATGEKLTSIHADYGMFTSLAFSPDGQQLASNGIGSLVHLWDVVTGLEVKTLSDYPAAVGKVAFSPDGAAIAAMIPCAEQDDKLNCVSSVVELRDAAQGVTRAVFTSPTGRIWDMAFNPDNVTLALILCAEQVACTTLEAALWHSPTNSLQIIPTEETPGISDLTYRPDGMLTASGLRDGILFQWDISPFGQIEAKRGGLLSVGHTSEARDAAFSPDGRQIVSVGGADILIWDIENERPIRTMQASRKWLYSVAWSADGKFVASGGDEGLQIWDAVTGETVQSREVYEGSVFDLAFSPDSRLLAFADGTKVRLWDMAANEERDPLEMHASTVTSIAFNPAGTLLASGDRTGEIFLCSLPALDQCAPVKYPGDLKMSGIGGLAFNPDGSIITSGNYDNLVRLWDTASGGIVSALEGHTFGAIYTGINDVAFSPEGALIASAAWDDSLRLWDAATGKALAVLPNNAYSVNCAVFSPDGTHLITCGADGVVRLWSVAN